MKIVEQVLSVRSSKRCQMIDITRQVAEYLAESAIKAGIVTIYCPHTTAAITINENADPDVPHDMLLTLDKIFPQNFTGYRHNEGNSDAHIKSSLIGCSRQIIVRNGKMLLGTWQGIFFCEFDGARTRTINIQIMGE